VVEKRKARMRMDTQVQADLHRSVVLNAVGSTA
jgi:hypothetical protein